MKHKEWTLSDELRLMDLTSKNRRYRAKFGHNRRKTASGMIDFLKDTDSEGIHFNKESIRSEFGKLRNPLSDRINRMQSSAIKRNSINYGSLGALGGLTVAELTVLGLKGRLKKKYPNKSEADINLMVHDIAVKRGIAGALVGAILSGGIAAYKAKSSYDKVRRRLADITDEIYKRK